jgi:hypothetical protein
LILTLRIAHLTLGFDQPSTRSAFHLWFCQFLLFSSLVEDECGTLTSLDARGEARFVESASVSSGHIVLHWRSSEPFLMLF